MGPLKNKYFLHEYAESLGGYQGTSATSHMSKQEK